SPAPAPEESVGRRRTGQTDAGEQERRPAAHTGEALARVTVEPPHRFQKASRKEKRHEGETARHDAEGEEAGERGDSGRPARRGRRSGHGGFQKNSRRNAAVSSERPTILFVACR